MNATMPVWGAVALAIVVALLPQIAAFVLQRSRLSAEAALKKERMAADAERERQNRDEDREEWHLNVRWAAEQIIAGTEQGRVTVEMLDVLDDAEFVTDHELALIDAILLSVIGSEPWTGTIPATLGKTRPIGNDECAEVTRNDQLGGRGPGAARIVRHPRPRAGCRGPADPQARRRGQGQHPHHGSHPALLRRTPGSGRGTLGERRATGGVVDGDRKSAPLASLDAQPLAAAQQNGRALAADAVTPAAPIQRPDLHRLHGPNRVVAQEPRGMPGRNRQWMPFASTRTRTDSMTAHNTAISSRITPSTIADAVEPSRIVTTADAATATTATPTARSTGQGEWARPNHTARVEPETATGSAAGTESSAAGGGFSTDATRMPPAMAAMKGTAMPQTGRRTPAASASPACGARVVTSSDDRSTTVPEEPAAPRVTPRRTRGGEDGVGRVSTYAVPAVRR